MSSSRMRSLSTSDASGPPQTNLDSSSTPLPIRKTSFLPRKISMAENGEFWRDMFSPKTRRSSKLLSNSEIKQKEERSRILSRQQSRKESLVDDKFDSVRF